MNPPPYSDQNYETPYHQRGYPPPQQEQFSPARGQGPSHGRGGRQNRGSPQRGPQQRSGPPQQNRLVSE